MIVRFSIFITILHEIRHHKQYGKKSINEVEDYKSLKEIYIEEYEPNYYEFNYRKLLEEIDARLTSYNMITKFLEKFFPKYLNKIQDLLIEQLNGELKFKKEQTNTRQIIGKKAINFELAFDTLIKYNKSILEKEPLFNIEYNKDGTPKKIEQLLEVRNEENYKIIDAILKRRYDYIYIHQKKSL